MSNEITSATTTQKYFEGLNDIYIDPAISSVFKKIEIYTELLKAEYVGSAQINEIMTELDLEWHSLLGETASLTGMMSFFPEDVIEPGGVTQKDYYENQEIIFRGVLPVETGTQYRQSDEEDLHTYELRLAVEREGITSDGGYVHMRGNALIDEVIAIEFMHSMSLERARRWLEYYHEDVLEDIEFALLNESTEECEMVMRLADIVIDTHAMHEGDEDLILRSSQAFMAYTNSLFSFDKEAPYDLKAKGDAWIVINGEAKAAEISEPLERLAVIDKLLWISVDGETTLRPHLDLKLMNDSKDAESVHLLLPVASVTMLRSMRYAYFVGYET